MGAEFGFNETALLNNVSTDRVELSCPMCGGRASRVDCLGGSLNRRDSAEPQEERKCEMDAKESSLRDG